MDFFRFQKDFFYRRFHRSTYACTPHAAKNDASRLNLSPRAWGIFDETEYIKRIQTNIIHSARTENIIQKNKALGIFPRPAS